MSEKPAPAALPARFLSAALSILFGSIALYLSVQLLQSMLGDLVGIGLCVLIVTICLAILRLRRRLRASRETW
jgi:hypothetical protein